MKTCNTCGVEKELSEFIRRKVGSRDGRDGKCKQCASIARKIYRDRDRDRESLREYDRNRMRSHSYPPERRIQYRAKFPGKYKAHTAVTNALASGKITKPESCEGCDATERIQAHHDDYAKLLEVRWLCAVCHKKWHMENGEAINGE